METRTPVNGIPWRLLPADVTSFSAGGVLVIVGCLEDEAVDC